MMNSLLESQSSKRMCNKDDGSSVMLGAEILSMAREGHGGDGILRILEQDPTLIHVTDAVGDTILHVVARGGDLEVAKRLVGFVKEHGLLEVLMEQNSQGETPLDLAAANPNKDVACPLSSWIENTVAKPFFRKSFRPCVLFSDIEMELENRALYETLGPETPPAAAQSIPMNVVKEFILAIIKGQQDLVFEALREHPDLASCKLCSMGSFLHVAAKCGQVDMLRSLVSQMTPGKATSLMLEGDAKGNTPLHVALQNYFKDAAHYLIELEPRAAYQVNKKGVSPLNLAVMGDYEDLVKLIFQLMPMNRGLLAPVEASLVTAAIYRGNLGIIKLLVGQLTSDEIASLMLGEDFKGDTPLHVALNNIEYKDIASYLIELMPNAVYKVNKRGVSPLHLAVERGHEDIVKYIFKIIPVANISSSTRESLHAAKKGSLGHTAIKIKNLGILESLMQELPELIDVLDYKGWRVLSYAAYKGYLDGVRYLLRNFPNSVKKYDCDGSLPIHKAVGGGHVSIVKEFLLRCPETVNDVDQKGQSILHFAAKYTKADVLSYLTKETTEGQKIFDLKDNEGKTFVDLANELKC